MRCDTSRSLGVMFDRPGSAIAVGAVGGLAWAASLRAYMAELAGSATGMEWVGTFAQILLPGVLIGALLGLAEFFRRTGGRRGWRWLAAAPALFAIAPQLTPEAFIALVTTGIGGGAISVALIGIGGGYALSGRGPLWARIVTGVLAAVLTIGSAAVAFFLPLTARSVEPRAVWVALLFASLMVVFALACSIPHRPLVLRATVTPAAAASPSSQA